MHGWMAPVRMHVRLAYSLIDKQYSISVSLLLPSFQLVDCGVTAWCCRNIAYYHQLIPATVVRVLLASNLVGIKRAYTG